MDDKEFNKLLGLWKKDRLSRIEKIAPQISKDCLYFTELEAYVKKGGEALNEAKRQHIRSCSHCQQMIAGFEKTLGEKSAFENLINALTLPFRSMPRFAPALVPVLAVVIILAVIYNQPIRLDNYSFELSPSSKIRGTQISKEKVFRVLLTPSSNCYAYLFTTEDSGVSFLVEEKTTGKIKNIIPKDKWLQGEGKLIILLSKDPLKNTSAAAEIIFKTKQKSEKETEKMLRKELKRNDIGFFVLKE